jgi:hypothetical protein
MSIGWQIWDGEEWTSPEKFPIGSMVSLQYTYGRTVISYSTPMEVVRYDNVFVVCRLPNGVENIFLPKELSLLIEETRDLIIEKTLNKCS